MGEWRRPRNSDSYGESGRVSTAVVQRFCKPKVGGSNPSPGIARPSSGFRRSHGAGGTPYSGIVAATSAFAILERRRIPLRMQ